MPRAEAKIFSRVSSDPFGNEMLTIYHFDQGLFPEGEQLPSMIITKEESVCRCIWPSRELVSEAWAKIVRTFHLGKDPVRYNDYEGGFVVKIDGAELSYEGNQGSSYWGPRFAFVADSLPLKPLSQLIASTVLERGLPQRRIEELTRDFIQSAATL